MTSLDQGQCLKALNKISLAFGRNSLWELQNLMKCIHKDVLNLQLSLETACSKAAFVVLTFPRSIS